MMKKDGEGKEESGLRRNVDLFQAVMYGVGLILGAGIYVLIGDVAGIAGNAMWISFIVATFIATCYKPATLACPRCFPKALPDMCTSRMPLATIRLGSFHWGGS